MQFFDDFKTRLSNSLNEPVAITAFKNGVSVPFNIIICSDNTVDSDDKTYAVGHSLTIERYTETAGEQENLEQFLISNNIPYEKDQSYLDDERLFMTVYDLKDIYFEKNIRS